MCEENGVGESQIVERQRERMCERWSVQERRIAWVKDKGILTVTEGNDNYDVCSQKVDVSVQQIVYNSFHQRGTFQIRLQSGRSMILNYFFF